MEEVISTLGIMSEAQVALRRKLSETVKQAQTLHQEYEKTRKNSKS